MERPAKKAQGGKETTAGQSYREAAGDSKEEEEADDVEEEDDEEEQEQEDVDVEEEVAIATILKQSEAMLR